MNKSTVGRKPKYAENLTERVVVYFTPTQVENLKEQAQGSDVGSFIRHRAITGTGFPPPSLSTDVPVLGYIAAGPGMQVLPLPPGTTVRPPFTMDKQAYALIVTGDSMEADYGLTIPNGSYAFLSPDKYPVYGSVVHVEFPRSDGDNDCTLKRYCPQSDGVTVRFEPLNKKHKTITKKEGEYEIRGVFVRAWGGQ